MPPIFKPSVKYQANSVAGSILEENDSTIAVDCWLNQFRHGTLFHMNAVIMKKCSRGPFSNAQL